MIQNIFLDNKRKQNRAIWRWYNKHHRKKSDEILFKFNKIVESVALIKRVCKHKYLIFILQSVFNSIISLLLVY